MQRSALDAEVRRSVNEKLEKSGEKERYVGYPHIFFRMRRIRNFTSQNVQIRLKELLRQKLAESGWRDQLKEHCKVAHAPLHSPALLQLARPSPDIFLRRMFFARKVWKQSASRNLLKKLLRGDALRSLTRSRQSCFSASASFWPRINVFVHIICQRLIYLARE